MKMQKFLPSPALAPYVKEYLLIESNLHLQNKTIPDTSIVMSFRYRGEVLKINEAGNKELISETAISGLRKSARVFHYAENTSNLLVIFKEGGLAAFSKVPIHELFESTISSDQLFKGSELTEILEKLNESATNGGRIIIIESFLLDKLLIKNYDPLISKAIQLIERQNGNVRIKDFVSNFHITQDPFEKRFRKMVGSSPKQFSSILRLRHLIRNYPSFTSLTEATYSAGYFDQSHFIKDFRQFTGQTPKDFFKSPLYW